MKRFTVAVAVSAAALFEACGPEMTTPEACAGRAAGDFVISEVMIDPEGSDTGSEWIEVFNTLGTPVDMKGLTVYTRDTDGSGSKTHVIRAGSVPARGYFVLGDVRSGPNPSWVNYSYADGLGSFGNSRGVVGIRCGQTTLGEFTWTTAAKPNRSRMLDGVGDPSPVVAAVEANFCDAPAGNVYIGSNAGTPGSPNPRCQAEATVGTCVDNGAVRAMTPPQPGELVITEVMASPKASGDTTGEWIEVLARATVDLNDVSINTTGGSTRITNMTCLRVQPGEYVLLARSGDTFVNGGLPTPRHVYGALSFADSTNQRISLSRGDAGIDEVALLPSVSGRAWQLDPLKLDPASNDDPNHFCPAPKTWNLDGGGDYGSPGAANPECPPDAGMITGGRCIDGTTNQERDVRRPADGELVITEWHSSPQATTAANGEFIEVLSKGNADLNGVTLQIGTSKTVIASSTCVSVNANSYLVFGKNGDPALNGGLPALTASFSAALTGSSTISLVGSDGGLYDSITATGELSGVSQQIAPGFETPADNDLTGNRCRSPQRWAADGGGDFGSPGLVNPACVAVDAGMDPSLCVDPVTQQARPIVAPVLGDMVITEWMSDPGAISDSIGEYFEVLTKQNADLNGLTLRVGSTVTRLSSATCLPVDAGSFLVFGKVNDSSQNGNLPSLTSTFGGSLTGASVISVLSADGGLHDTITANGETSGASAQVKPGFENATDNDVVTNRCTTPAGVQYGPIGADGGVTGNRGTPGKVNVACP